MNLQLCLVLSDRLDSHAAQMYRYEKYGTVWKLIDTHPVVIGKKGITFDKREGDGKTPAGIFTFGTVFGFQECRLKVPYIKVDEDFECVDDPKSVYYNQFVNRDTPKDWDSSEKILSIDLYKWGIFVNYNTEQIPYKGSCIFFHLWKDRETGTAGCTAMEEEKLKKLIFWLDPAKKPLLVQLPLEEYKKQREVLGFPELFFCSLTDAENKDEESQ